MSTMREPCWNLLEVAFSLQIFFNQDLDILKHRGPTISYVLNLESGRDLRVLGCRYYCIEYPHLLTFYNSIYMLAWSWYCHPEDTGHTYMKSTAGLHRYRPT